MLVMNHSFSSYFVFTPKSNLRQTSVRPERMRLTCLAIPLSRRKTHVDHRTHFSCAHDAVHDVLRASSVRSVLHEILTVIISMWIAHAHACFRCSVYYHAQCDKGHRLVWHRYSTSPFAAQATSNPYCHRYVRCSFHVVVWDWITRRRGDEMFIGCATCML